MEKGTNVWKTLKFQKHLMSYEDDVIAEEFPLTILINGQEFATMACTPANLKELVVGFLASEGIILTYSDIQTISIDSTDGFAYVELNKPFTNDQASQKRWIGSCCGKSRVFYFKNDVKTARTITSQMTITPAQCMELMNTFQYEATMFQQTGGVHQASIATEHGLMISFADIGRHNALDKLYGKVLIDRIPLRNKLIIFSGRISSEVLLKVSKMRIGLVLSKSAPTNLALQLAQDLNITAIGFIRGDRMNVYTHEKRINSSHHYEEKA
ncbi:formate dehydrogenase accessory sulfurtransferase FdhD [Bacillus tianshenii]|nr:formate dehydrogenase accessory sulfurtransferase FdhD [Bacillus tianshenii]